MAVKMRYGRPEEEIPAADVYRETYYGDHTVRAVGCGAGSNTILVLIPWINPDGETPTVSSITASIDGIGNVTAALDTARTNSDAIAFTLTGSNTNHYAYVCRVNFTLS